MICSSVNLDRFIVRLLSEDRTLTLNRGLFRGAGQELYAILGVLDSKTSALLRFDAMLSVLLALLVMPRNEGWQSLGGWDLGVFVGGLVLLGASMLLCLSVVRVAWPFYGKMTNVDVTNIKNECADLARVIDKRTICYQWAWLLAFLTLIGMSIWFLCKLINP
jgi:hypothetical protein